MKHISVVLLFGSSLTAASILGAADNANVLDEAVYDYTGSSPTSMSSSHSQAKIILDNSYYDWVPQDFQSIEEAEFAAFEVPETLQVQD